MATFVVTWLYQGLRNTYSRLTGDRQPQNNTKPSTSTDKPCRYLLDTSTSATLTLPDGRKLGYAQYGSPNGKPIFWLHGFPGSRLEAALLDEQAKEHNARIISIDRPGGGWSSPHPNRTLLDHANDVQLLAESLRVEEFAVMGASGGGPYVLACAASIPTAKLKAVSNVCGLGLPDMSKRGMDWAHWAGFPYGWLYTPRLSRWYMSRAPGARLDLSDEKRFELMSQEVRGKGSHPRDLEVWDDDMIWLSLRSSQETFSQGFDAMMQDGKVLCSDPGFRMEDIPRDLPIQLWYGKYDTSVGLVGEVIAARLGDRDNVTFHLEDETHASILMNNKGRILKELVESMSR